MWLLVNFLVSADTSGGGELTEEILFSMDSLIVRVTSCVGVPENIVGPFSVTLLFLLLFSVFKFFIGNKLAKKEWGDLLLEFPIDLCVAVATLQTTLLSSLNSYVYNGTLAISFVIAILCCMIRREAIEKMDNHSHLGYALFGILSMVLVLAWIVCLTYIIY